MRLIPLAALLAAAAVSTGCEKVSDKAFGARVHSYLLAHPEVIEEAALKLEKTRAESADSALKAKLVQNRPALERDKRDFVANPNGKITVVEFFDYRCGYCKKAAPEVVKLIAEHPDVRFVFKELPIFGEVSEKAAAVALAAKDDGRYLSVYNAFFATNLTAESLSPTLAASRVWPRPSRSRGSSGANSTALR